MLLVTTTAVAAPSSTEPPPILGYHVVQMGETLFCIGRAYQVDPWAIASSNAILNVNSIQPGMELAIPEVAAILPPGPTCTPQFGAPPPPTPPPLPSCTCRQMHLIVTGQTLYQIATYYGVDMQSIATCNNIQDLNYIRIGDTLCIP